MSEEENITKESITKTVGVVGELYPILINQNGKRLDGDHRVESNPKWHTKTIPTKSRLEEIIVRLTAHHRRRVPKIETQSLILEAAKELEATGVEKDKVSSELVKLLPYSDQYIRELLSVEYKQKEKVEAARLTEHPVYTKCDYDGIPTSEPHEWTWGNKTYRLCDLHLKGANNDPLHTEQVIKRRTGEIPKVPEKKPTREVRPSDLDTWENRKAHMSLEHSKFEEAVIQWLIDHGVRNIVRDRQFCALSSIPDVYLPEKGLILYFDGVEVHKGKEERDEHLREMVVGNPKNDLKRYKAWTYERPTAKEVERVGTEILEELKQ